MYITSQGVPEGGVRSIVLELESVSGFWAAKQPGPPSPLKGVAWVPPCPGFARGYGHSLTHTLAQGMCFAGSNLYTLATIGIQETTEPMVGETWGVAPALKGGHEY